MKDLQASSRVSRSISRLPFAVCVWIYPSLIVMIQGKFGWTGSTSLSILSYAMLSLRIRTELLIFFVSLYLCCLLQDAGIHWPAAGPADNDKEINFLWGVESLLRKLILNLKVVWSTIIKQLSYFKWCEQEEGGLPRCLLYINLYFLSLQGPTTGRETSLLSMASGLHLCAGKSSPFAGN